MCHGYIGIQSANNTLNEIPPSDINSYSESYTSSNQDRFEPREDRKGDIARSMYYFYTIYTNEIDYYFFEDQKDVLYQWHIQDPATEDEIRAAYEQIHGEGSMLE